jgi:NTP pyrophosphatase (non-canonical NTP hydrolase)
MELQELQEKVDRWIKEYGVRYFDERTNMLILIEEVGELSRYMSRKFGEQSFKSEEDEQNAMARISDELADILFVSVCLANQMDIDLTRAMEQNLEKKTRRDATRHKENKKINP